MANATSQPPSKEIFGHPTKHLTPADGVWHARAMACVSACTLLGGNRFRLPKQGLKCSLHPVYG